MWRLLILGLLAVILTAATAPSWPSLQSQAALPPPAAYRPEVRRLGSRASINLEVMTFNVRGLPAPLRLNADVAASVLARELLREDHDGRGPDVIFIQEGFLASVAALGASGLYPYAAHGPNAATRGADMPISSDIDDPDLTVGADILKGEGLGKVVGSGLHVFSRYPISSAREIAYGPDACAGYDCLANKGALIVRLRIPGMPEDVQLFTTHMNSQRASGVSNERSGAAHRRQMLKLAAFLGSGLDDDLAVIFGGDFNTKNAPARRDLAARHLGVFRATHLACAADVGACRLGVPYDPARHWLESRDVQGYRNGARVDIAPLGIELAFDAPVEGVVLSDHAAVRARYRLSWPVAAEPEAESAAAGKPSRGLLDFQQRVSTAQADKD